MPTPSTLILSLITFSLLIAPTLAQTFYENGCLRLSGSNACPGFSSAYVNPANLSNAFPFFADVTDVASFDAGVFTYLSDPNQYRATKFERQLGCTNSSQATLRYARTVLCSSWVNSRWSIECFNLYNASNIATGPKMVCQDTCIQYAEDEQQIVDNQEYCPGPDLTNGARQGNLTKDFVQCTNWTTLATNDSARCVMGDTNEGNCGFGPSSDQLCAFCNSSDPQACCYQSNTDLTPCAYTLASLPSSTSSSSATSSATAGVVGGSPGSSGLSKGQIAGIVVGSVLGGLLLIALLIALLVCCGCLALGSFGRKRKQQRQSHASSFAGAGHTPVMPSGALLAPSAISVDRSRHDSQGSVPQMSQLSRAGTGVGILPGGSSSRTMLQSGASSFGASSQEKLGRGGYGGKAAPIGLGAPLIAAGMASSSDGRTLLNSVRDENQSGEHLILPNSMVTVLWPYVASLPDELSLRPGMRLTVLRIYDDAWGTGQITSGSDEEIGQQGAFPLVCVTENNTDSSARSSDTNGKDDAPSESARWSSHHGHGSNI